MAQTQPISVVIADDHAIARERLRALFGDEKSAIIGEASDGVEAIAKISILQPDIVLMDAALPGQNGVEVAAALKRAGLKSRIILLTDRPGDDLRLQEAIDAGVMGYLLKDVSKNALLWTIESVHRGAPVFHPAIQKQLIRLAAGGRAPHADLTPRELDILKEIARGKSNKAIAHDLTLTEGTVKGYVSVVLSKLSVDDRTGAALYAVKHGLVLNDPPAHAGNS